jgi:hypothetical protein
MVALKGIGRTTDLYTVTVELSGGVTFERKGHSTDII